MHLSGERASESCLRERLEFCFDQGILEEAIQIGSMLDNMQCLLLMQEQKKAARGVSAVRLSFKLVHA